MMEQNTKYTEQGKKSDGGNESLIKDGREKQESSKTTFFKLPKKHKLEL